MARRGRVAGVVGRAVLATAVAAGALVAVGATEPAGAATWAIQPSADRAGGNLVYDVSCRTATSCVAVGNYQHPAGSRFKPLALGLASGTWSVHSTPSYGTSSELFGVSCPTTTQCYAVGRRTSASDFCCTPLVLVWRDGTWKQMAIPMPPVSYYVALNDISCPSASRCFAVGMQRDDRTFRSRTVVYTLIGGAWKLVPSQNRQGTLLGNELQDVSCVTATSCVAVGAATRTEDQHTLTLQLRDGEFRFVTSPRRNGALGASRLNGVSCTSATHCVAVGEWRDANGWFRALAMTFDGSGWVLGHVPAPTDTADQYLSGVSCTSATRCFAAGKVFRWITGVPEDDHPHIAELSGATWSLPALPEPPGTGDRLHGVSCRGTTRCVAAGWTQVGSRVRTLTLTS